jgi:hypothetical protein
MQGSRPGTKNTKNSELATLLSFKGVLFPEPLSHDFTFLVVLSLPATQPEFKHSFIRTYHFTSRAMKRKQLLEA